MVYVTKLDWGQHFDQNSVCVEKLARVSHVEYKRGTSGLHRSLLGLVGMDASF